MDKKITLAPAYRTGTPDEEPPDPRPDEMTLPLSRRELEVVGLVAEGLQNAEIARRLWLSENTIKSHIRHVLAKLGASNRAQAVAIVTASKQAEVVAFVQAGVEETATKILANKASIDELRAEFVTADRERGKGRMTPAEIERAADRMERMEDRHLVMLLLGCADIVHARLSGSEHDLFTHVKCAFLDVARRWMPLDVLSEAIDAYHGEEEVDFGYLDDAEAA